MMSTQDSDLHVEYLHLSGSLIHEYISDILCKCFHDFHGSAMKLEVTLSKKKLRLSAVVMTGEIFLPKIFFSPSCVILWTRILVFVK